MKTKPYEKESTLPETRHGDIPIVVMLFYCAWQTFFPLNKNVRFCLLQTLLQFYSSPTPLCCPLSVFTYMHKVKLAEDSVESVIKTSDKNQKLLTLVKVTTLETLGTSRSYCFVRWLEGACYRLCNKYVQVCFVISKIC